MRIIFFIISLFYELRENVEMEMSCEKMSIEENESRWDNCE